MTVDEWRRGLTPAIETEERWGDAMRLSLAIYFTRSPPPPGLVSSVRAVVFRGRRVAVVATAAGERHVVPGGRIEPGETPAAALGREVMEECGWSIGAPTLFGVIHCRHLGPRPPPPYDDRPYPDFMQPLFVAEADRFHRGAIKRAGEIETGSRMTPIAAAMAMLEEGQRQVLEAALAARRDGAGAVAADRG